MFCPKRMGIRSVLVLKTSQKPLGSGFKIENCEESRML